MFIRHWIPHWLDYDYAETWTTNGTAATEPPREISKKHKPDRIKNKLVINDIEGYWG